MVPRLEAANNTLNMVRSCVVGGLIIGVPLLTWPPGSGFEAPKLALLSLGSGLLALSLSAARNRGHSRKFQLGPLTLFAIGLLVCCTPAFFGGYSVLNMTRGFYLIGCWSIVHESMRHTWSDSTGRRVMLQANAAAVFLVATIALAQMAGWIAVKQPYAMAGRGIATLGNPNYVAGYLAISVFLVVVPASRTRISKIILSLVVTVALGALVSAGSTGALLALAGGGVPLGLALLLSRIKRFPSLGRAYAGVVGLTTAMLAVGLVFVVSVNEKQDNSHGINQRVIADVIYGNQGYVRLREWSIATDILDTPQLGVGLNNYKVAWILHRARISKRLPEPATPPPNYSHDLRRQARAHNEYLQLAAEGGWPSLVLMSGFAVWLVVAAIRRYGQLTSDPERLQFLLCLAGLQTAAAHALVSFPFHLPASSLAIALAGAGVFPAAPRKIIPVESWPATV